MQSVELQKAAFIDRDGVINEDRHYVHKKEDFAFLPGAIEGLKTLMSAGYALVIVTNQAGVARGYYDEEAVQKLHDYMCELLESEGARIDAIYYCPHHVQGSVRRYAYRCKCRKPNAGMILQAQMDLRLDLSRSILIGDKLSDIEAGRNAGLGRTILVESGHPISNFDRTQADSVERDLQSAAAAIVAWDIN